MSDLTDFLLARITEELDNIEPAKVGWVTFRWPDGSLAYTSVASWDEDGVWVLDGRPVYPHSGEVFFDPERVRADLEAKRALVEHFGPNIAYGGPRDTGADHDAWFTLLTLARPYAGHPDFMNQWAVMGNVSTDLERERPE